jgi:antitoxin component YwqK of YwqJK toxin-antitoxin module
MRIRLIFLLFLLASVALNAQDTVNIKDPEGRKNGFWIKKDTIGSKIYEGRFSHDIPYGEFRYYYPEGGLKAVNFISDGGKRSRTTTYYKNGRKMAEGIYVDEKKDSIWKFYSQYETVIVSEENYKNGRKDGISKTFYTDGVVAEIMTWKDGVRNGLWEQYYTDGKLKLKCAFADDMKNGPLRTFHINGKPWLTGQYANGNADGTWAYLDEKGIPSKKEYYKMGRLIRTEDFQKKEEK